MYKYIICFIIIILIYYYKINTSNKLEVELDVYASDDQYSSNGMIIIYLNGKKPYDIIFNNKLTRTYKNKFIFKNLNIGTYTINITDSNNEKVNSEAKIKYQYLNPNIYYWNYKCILNDDKTKYIPKYHCETYKNKTRKIVDNHFCNVQNLNKPEIKCPYAPYQIIDSFDISKINYKAKVKIGIIKNNKVLWLTVDDDLLNINNEYKRKLYFDDKNYDGSDFIIEKISSNKYIIYNIKNGKNIIDNFIHNGILYANTNIDGEIQPINYFDIIKDKKYFNIVINNQYVNIDKNYNSIVNNNKSSFIFKRLKY